MLKTACIQQHHEGHDSLCCQTEIHATEVLTAFQVAHEDMNTYGVGLGHRARELGCKKGKKEGVWHFFSSGLLSVMFGNGWFSSLLIRSCYHRKERGWLILLFCLPFPVCCWSDLAYSLRRVGWGSGKVMEVSLQISCSVGTCVLLSQKNLLDPFHLQQLELEISAREVQSSVSLKPYAPGVAGRDTVEVEMSCYISCC